MKIALAIALLTAGSAFAADVDVRGYIRHDGTYVAPHHRSAPDRSIYNNYGTQPNMNPYTLQPGHVNPYAPAQQYPQQSAPFPYNPYGR